MNLNSNLLSDFDIFGEIAGDEAEFEFVNPADDSSQSESFKLDDSVANSPRAKWRLSKTVSTRLWRAKHEEDVASPHKPRSYRSVKSLDCEDEEDREMSDSPKLSKPVSSKFNMSAQQASLDSGDGDKFKSERKRSQKFFRTPSVFRTTDSGFKWDRVPLSKEMKDLVQVVSDKTLRFALITDLLNFKSEFALKVRFISVVTEYLTIQDEQDQAVKGGRIVHFFLRKGSMFYLTVSDELVAASSVPGSMKDVLEKLRYDFLSELLQLEQVKKILSE